MKATRCFKVFYLYLIVRLSCTNLIASVAEDKEGNQHKGREKYRHDQQSLFRQHIIAGFLDTLADICLGVSLGPGSNEPDEKGFSITFTHKLSFGCYNVPILNDIESFDDETVGIVIGAGDIGKAAGSDQCPLRHIRLTNDQLLGIGLGSVGVIVEIANHAVNLHHLIDIPAMMRL